MNSSVNTAMNESYKQYADDFLSEEDTNVEPYETMAEVMESVRSPGIPTLTSDMPTAPCRPAIINNMERK